MAAAAACSWLVLKSEKLSPSTRAVAACTASTDVLGLAAFTAAATISSSGATDLPSPKKSSSSPSAWKVSGASCHRHPAMDKSAAHARPSASIARSTALDRWFAQKEDPTNQIGFVWGCSARAARVLHSYKKNFSTFGLDCCPVNYIYTSS
jgi:hypothetical protein